MIHGGGAEEVASAAACYMAELARKGDCVVNASCYCGDALAFLSSRRHTVIRSRILAGLQLCLLARYATLRSHRDNL
eukprot:scaffold7226_cov115-Isochrysis_galbana.AAC.1